MLATGKKEEAFQAAEGLVSQLEEQGVEVLYDDRPKVSPGVKFKDSELIGVPLVAIAGRDTIENGTIEVRNRDGSDSVSVPVDQAAQVIMDRIAALG